MALSSSPIKSLTLFTVLLLGSCQAFFFGRSAKTPAWNDLKVTFGINPLSSYNHLPRTVAEATANGWKKDPTVGCAVHGTPFNGDRYTLANDRAAMLLFDKNGFIAGIQAGIPKTKEYPTKQNAKYHVFNMETDMWVITAYFTDPAKICTTGRTPTQVAREGTGTMLSIQNGPTADNLMRMPMDERRVLTDTNFVQGKCFWGMGVHYWYNVTSTMSCDDTFPVFLMYNKGRLNAFGWAFNPNYQTSNRWEHPTANVFHNFIKDPPACLGADGPVTTLHVYLTKYPMFNRC